jgi:hypothetical protein
MKAVVDNDILLKGACYGLLSTILLPALDQGKAGILGASRFVVPKKIIKSNLRGDPATAEAHFFSFVANHEIIEPTIAEQEMAALLEANAQKMALNLDAGESQLVAIHISRHVPLFLTGDKRAIASIDRLLDGDKRLTFIAQRIKCLEQLVRDVLTSEDADQVRTAICAEPLVDKSLNICFGCSSSSATVSTIVEGLSSYIAHLRSTAGRVLAS